MYHMITVMLETVYCAIKIKINHKKKKSEDVKHAITSQMTVSGITEYVTVS